jgi:hypothetical protein
MRCMMVVLALLVSSAAYGEECKDNPPPSDAKIRAMSYQHLYQWYKASQRAADLVAEYNARRMMHEPNAEAYAVPPCIRELASKQIAFEREMKFR